MKFIMRRFKYNSKDIAWEEEINLDSVIKLIQPKDVCKIHVGAKFSHYDEDESILLAEIEVLESIK